ncbi:Rv0361 family membrane protein [Micromonospora sp. CPCC 205556]|uniref:Rv0361 family membrane protein n=1 Tax=Micromonospora sp. CPCC 205556 TaxID=3122398 RepID=UPI002FF0C1D3
MTYQPIPVPPRDNRRTLRIVLIVVGVVLAVCCLGGAVGGFFLYGAAKEAVGPVREATTGYLDAVRAGDHQRAYELLCREERERTSRADFDRRQAAEPRLVDYDIAGLTVNNTNGRVRGTATVRLTTETGGESTRVLTLVKEDGAWRLCG